MCICIMCVCECMTTCAGAYQYYAVILAHFDAVMLYRVLMKERMATKLSSELTLELLLLLL